MFKIAHPGTYNAAKKISRSPAVLRKTLLLTETLSLALPVPVRFPMLGVGSSALMLTLTGNANATTCATGVTPAFAEVVKQVDSGQTSKAVTSLTPTMANALTGLSQQSETFLKDASLQTNSSTAVINIDTTQGGGFLTERATLQTTSGVAGTALKTENGTFLTSATLANTQGTAISSISSSGTASFLTEQTSLNPSSANAIVAVTPTTANFVSNVSTSTMTGSAATGIASTTDQTAITGVTVSKNQAQGYVTDVAASGSFQALTNVNLAAGTFVTGVTTTPTSASAVNGIFTQQAAFLTGETTLNAKTAQGITGISTTPGSFLVDSTVTSSVSQALTAATLTTGDFLTAATLDTSSQGAKASALTSLTPTTGQFIKSASLSNKMTGQALTGVNGSTAAFVKGVDIQYGDFLTGAAVQSAQAVSNVVTNASGAQAIADTSLGCGLNAVANGQNSVSLGSAASTSDKDQAVAIGANASAGTKSVALGEGAKALGVGSVAIGENATTANLDNAVAIGSGATATRNNQVVLGTSSNTYTMPGITSSASRAAQKGPLQMVTTDSNGNLASDGGQIFNDITNINNNINVINTRLSNVESNVANLNRAVRRLDGGVSMAFALGNIVLPERQNYALAVNTGFYRNSVSMGVQGVARVSEKLVANGGVAFDLSGRGGVGGRVGIQMGW